MTLRNPWSLVLAFVLVMAASATVTQPRRNQENKFSEMCPADKAIAIRFFYHPPGDYFHFPLIFRPVDEADPRLNTAPMTTEGRTAYISIAEMRQLIEGLSHSDLSWQESEKVEALGGYRGLRDGSESMEILVVCSKGTARANLDPKKICKTLAPLDAALKAPRALWEFQGFRLNYGCKIPGFKYGEYPDHSP